MNPYAEFVRSAAGVVAGGRTLPLGGIAPGPKPEIAPDAPTALFFASHPDDETIGGGLALRLLRQARWNVIDLAITLGSLPERKNGRLEELRNACAYMGIGLELAAPSGLDRVRPATRAKEPSAWAPMVSIIRRILEKHRPRVIFFPHEHDWNSTHIGVHFLVMDAVREARSLECFLVETEFWGQMAAPNLLVEYTEDDAATLVAATSFHVGEVQRNPYHLLIPAWFQDNVRRGAELVGGQGGAAPAFLFAQLFRVRRWENGQIKEAYSGGRFLPSADNPAALFGH